MDTTAWLGKNVYSFTDDAKFATTLWVESNDKTLDFSGLMLSSVEVDLRLGGDSFIHKPSYSFPLGSLFGNETIARFGLSFDVFLRGAIGGPNADVFFGNGNENFLSGGAGDDVQCRGIETSR